ncbi:MAG: hypothetical protein DWQ47_14520 [Acidobacteria bacterium]|nr:MAG: hypothetical protein DWQ32_01920 [Acidobacteriota bacterium]REK02718.1 MAG: hypothetical protein DWQ38_10215 [Acidobacteriota bacterium]REK13477.1 MAG: hypothetical protein DWQ43_07610 [Acidobacteriota bacterium]REK41471.1 MAG: hypothetical protein DWQ47_14520 [Acidobacteriota bacterium]
MNPDLFEPYERLIPIKVDGRSVEVPENNTILRCLQFISMDTVSYGEFCWNGDCLNCRVRVKSDGKEKEAIACIVKARPGMEIESVSTELLQSLQAKPE